MNNIITLSTDPLSLMQDRLEAYLDNQQPFHKGYTYNELLQDLWSICNEDPHPADLMADFLEISGPIPETPAERTGYKRRVKGWPFRGYRKLTGRERGKIAGMRIPFTVLDSREWFGTFRQSKEWEKESRTWLLLIEAPIVIGVAVLTLALTDYRRFQKKLMEGEGFPSPHQWRLKWVQLKDKDVMGLEKVT